MIAAALSAQFLAPNQIDPSATEAALRLIEAAPIYRKHPHEISSVIPERARIFSPDDPRIVGMGTHAITFDLSTPIPNVVKMIKVAQVDGQLLVEAHPVSRLPGAVEETVTALRELLPREVVVPPHIEQKAESGEHFCLAPHLGAYPHGAVLEVVDSVGSIVDFSWVKNYGELRNLLESSILTISSIFKDRTSGYVVSVNGHRSTSGPEAAIGKMFFARVNANSYGTLYAGDLDHVTVQQTQRRNAYLESIGF